MDGWTTGDHEGCPNWRAKVRAVKIYGGFRSNQIGNNCMFVSAMLELFGFMYDRVRVLLDNAFVIHVFGFPFWHGFKPNQTNNVFQWSGFLLTMFVCDRGFCWQYLSVIGIFVDNVFPWSGFLLTMYVRMLWPQ